MANAPAPDSTPLSPPAAPASAAGRTLPTTTPSVLVVDDDDANLRLLTTLLLPEGYEVRTAEDGPAALASVAADPPDLVLLDVMMPGMDGYEVARRLKADAAAAGIPIIMVSAHGDRGARLLGLHAGAEDFLTKPVDGAELWLRVRNLLRLKRLGDALSQQGAELERQVESRTADLHQLAHYDSLTGLPNRALFRDTLQRTLALAHAQASKVAVLFLDVDHFKDVNDWRGHAAGDDLLKQLADRLAHCVRVPGSVGRLGGDEFAVVLVLEDGASGAARVATEVQAALKAPFHLSGSELTVSASIGIAVFPEDGAGAADDDALDRLIQCADMAMYEAKLGGRSTFRFFTAEMNAELELRLELEDSLRAAVARQEFVLHYQPKVEAGSGTVVGVEALLRWVRPGAGFVRPGAFLSALESTGLIVQVGSWVIDEACRQLAVWAARGRPALTISVNVSGRQFCEGDLVGDVTAALQRHAVPAHLLELELTEDVLMVDTDRTLEALHSLKALGVRIAVDDFGTGSSSLAHLRHFPIDTLKIDLAFVGGITVNPDDAAVALMIIRMAHSLQLDVVAKGVETAAQLEFLRRHGCDQAQGYLFSRPLSAVALDALLRDGVDVYGRPGLGEQAETLLLFGSDPLSLLALEDLLGRDGQRVLATTSVDEALELLALHPVQVLVSNQAHRGEGERLLGLVQRLHADVLRIVIGGSSVPQVLAEAIRQRVHRCHMGPWEPEALRTDVRDAFRHHRQRHGAEPAELSA